MIRRMLESTLAIAAGVDARGKDYGWQFINEERWLEILIATATDSPESPGRR
jgi:hypothetical protein